jgi:hypothetical protein
MEVRMVLGSISGTFCSWANVFALAKDEEEIVTPVTLLCVLRRARSMRGLSI